MPTSTAHGTASRWPACVLHVQRAGILKLDCFVLGGLESRAAGHQPSNQHACLKKGPGSHGQQVRKLGHVHVAGSDATKQPPVPAPMARRIPTSP